MHRIMSVYQYVKIALFLVKFRCNYNDDVDLFVNSKGMNCVCKKKVAEPIKSQWVQQPGAF